MFRHSLKGWQSRGYALKSSICDGWGEHFEQQHEPVMFPTTEDDAFRVVRPVNLSFDVEPQETGRYRVAGRLTGAIELVCGRCVEPFTLPVAADFDLRYVPRIETGEEGEKEVEEDDLATAFYSDDRLDLAELIMEQFHLALPMKPLCAPSCRGLCMQCGTNLNTGSCGCTQEWVDPRLAVLKKFKA